LLKDAGRFFETQRIRDHVVSLAATAERVSGARRCPGRCCRSEVGVAPPEPIGSGC
jgi:hypothetical protein